MRHQLTLEERRRDGKNRMAKLTPEERTELAQKGWAAAMEQRPDCWYFLKKKLRAQRRAKNA